MPFGQTADVNRTTMPHSKYSTTDDARKHCGTVDSFNNQPRYFSQQEIFRCVVVNTDKVTAVAEIHETINKESVHQPTKVANSEHVTYNLSLLLKVYSNA
jgi:hypothetical protein